MGNYIDVDKFVKWIEKQKRLSKNYTIMMLQETPTADVVKVCRCEKCKHGDVSIIGKSKDGEETVACYCNLEGKVCSLEWYCPNGERKDAE